MRACALLPSGLDIQGGKELDECVSSPQPHLTHCCMLCGLCHDRYWASYNVPFFPEIRRALGYEVRCGRCTRMSPVFNTLNRGGQ